VCLFCVFLFTLLSNLVVGLTCCFLTEFLIRGYRLQATTELKSDNEIAAFGSTLSLSISAPFDIREHFITAKTGAIWFTADILNRTVFFFPHASLHLSLAGPTQNALQKSSSQQWQLGKPSDWQLLFYNAISLCALSTMGVSSAWQDLRISKWSAA